jgi:hypothetical protein
MQQRILSIVDEGHAQFFPLRTMQRLLLALPESDRNDRKVAHAEELMALTSSRLDEEHHRNCALAIGMNHAMEGIAYDELVQTHAILMATVSRHIDTAEHEDALEIFTRREYRSLALYAEAYAQADALYSTALLEITRLVWRAETYTDFINQVVQTLSKHLPILGCSMDCSDEHGVFRFEATVGTGIHDFILEMENSLQPVVSEGSQGPTARAWSDGRIAHCLHFETDHRMVFWCAAARRAGCRSSAAVPLAIAGQIRGRRGRRRTGNAHGDEDTGRRSGPGLRDRQTHVRKRPARMATVPPMGRSACPCGRIIAGPAGATAALGRTSQSCPEQGGIRALLACQ